MDSLFKGLLLDKFRLHKEQHDSSKTAKDIKTSSMLLPFTCPPERLRSNTPRLLIIHLSGCLIIPLDSIILHVILSSRAAHEFFQSLFQFSKSQTPPFFFLFQRSFLALTFHDFLRDDLKNLAYKNSKDVFKRISLSEKFRMWTACR